MIVDTAVESSLVTGAPCVVGQLNIFQSVSSVLEVQWWDLVVRAMGPRGRGAAVDIRVR